uniref:PfkB family carbohydrate kinase n=1 Tax=Enterobacter soli TaxID=885040 RepID=UPI0020CD8602
GSVSCVLVRDFDVNKGVKVVGLKTGADGAWFKTADGEQGGGAAVKVDNVVETGGDGDGFAGGVISALLEGKTLQQAVSRGNKIGSLAIQFYCRATPPVAVFCLPAGR